jgi:ankyrin repeat protein
LIIACANGYIEIVRYLISRGANVNALSNGKITEKSYGYTGSSYNNMTPLKFACKYNKLDVVRELIETGIVITPVELESLVKYANANYNIEMIEYLTRRA